MMHERGLELSRQFKPTRNEISKFIEITFNKGQPEVTAYKYFSDLKEGARTNHIKYIKSVLLAPNEEFKAYKIPNGPNTTGMYMQGLVSSELKSEAYITSGLAKFIQDKRKKNEPFILRLYKVVYDVPRDEKRLFVQGHFDTDYELSETYHFVVGVIIPIADKTPSKATSGFIYPGFVNRESNTNEIDIYDHLNKHYGVNFKQVFSKKK